MSPDDDNNLSQSTGLDGTDEIAIDPDLVPNLPTRGLPIRVVAERDVMAVLASAFVVAGALTALTAAITWDGRAVAGPWPLFALFVPHLLIFTAVLAAAYLILPTTRWLAPEELARRTPPPLLRLARVLGVLALPLAPLLETRERHERNQPAVREDIERALTTLLGLPRTIAGLVFGGLVAVALSDALIAGHQLQWSWPTAAGHLALWLALAGPIALLSAAGVQQAVRADILAAPQALLPLRDPPPMTRSVRLAASVALLAAAAAPLLFAELWVQAQDRVGAQRSAERRARSLLAAIGPGQEAELGQLLAEIPGAAVETASGARYGNLSIGPGVSGPIDGDGDGEPERLVVIDAGSTAAVSIPRPSAPPLPLLILAGALCLLAGGLGVHLLASERERDLKRLRARIAADDRSAPVLAPGTPEWLALAQAVDQLVGRMHEATIARFVALEKAEETDRLRSQFLANMSHDLRSPLNSILGFSSLLLRGVDGRLDDEQREMVETIASAGNDLLHQIDAILDMARIEARRIELQAEPVPLAPLISRAVQKARTRTSDQIHYSIETAPGLPTAFVDPRHMVQALENLLLFAGKRLPAGTIAIKLRAGDRDSPLGLQLHITTPVKPATSQQLDLARRGFHRLPGHRGLGLELPIADALLRIEGSRLDVKEIGGAMLFKIHLPAAASRQRFSVRERAQVHASTGESGEPARP